MNQTVQKWYEESFGEDYLLIYRHRNREHAESEVQNMLQWLKLPHQSHILDLCCGTGRHALTFANANYRVTGVDLSSILLQVARKSDPNNRVTWIESDMRALPNQSMFTEGFDAVVNLFTSFGYFDDDSEQMKVLLQIRRALKSNGQFVIDLMNASYTAENLVPFSRRVEQGAVISEMRQIEKGFVVKKIVIQEANRPPRHYTERVKLYSAEALTAMLNEAGLVLDSIYGSYDGQIYDPRLSSRMIMTGHRK